ncbi:MAG: hypothetical protein AAGA48_31400 [Myxococcota bacterium]
MPDQSTRTDRGRPFLGSPSRQSHASTQGLLGIGNLARLDLLGLNGSTDSPEGASTLDGVTTLPANATPHMAAHEEVHREQYANWERGVPAASVSDLENEANQGASARLEGEPFRAKLGVPKGQPLAYSPEDETERRPIRSSAALIQSYNHLYQRLDLLGDAFRRTAGEWVALYRNVGTDYEAALSHHRDVVEQVRAEAETREAVLQWIYDNVCVGLIAYAANLAVASATTNARTDGFLKTLEDVAQKVASEMNVPSAGSFGDIGQGPLAFQNALLNKADTTHRRMDAHISELKYRLSEEQQRAFDEARTGWDPLMAEVEKFRKLETWVDTFESGLKRTGYGIGPLSVDHVALRKELRRSIWARWIPDHLHVRDVRNQTGPPTMSGEMVQQRRTDERYLWTGAALMTEFKELGILDAIDYPSRFSFLSKVAPSLVKWARAYQPKVMVAATP